ncbi:MAG: PEP-CTERM sorting domain-containing protein [Isosphaeraceae bacterium]|nr:PEP-CTERM sorting domain-containing protein [Isosphaeraceae bacterium]
MSKICSFVAVALISGLFAGSASAAPLYYLTLEASTSPTGSFSSTLNNVQANTTYYYEVVGTEAAIGTTNTKLPGGITSQASSDGMTSMGFNITDTSTSATPVVFGGGSPGLSGGNATTLASLYNNFSGANAGTYTTGNTGITGVRPISGTTGDGPGAFVIASGTFTTGATVGSTSLVSVAFGSVSAGLKFNSGANAVLVTSTNNPGDPVFAFRSLTLNGAGVAVPEPASMIMSGLGFIGVAGLTVFRRRKA